MADGWLTEQGATQRVAWQLQVTESMIRPGLERAHWSLAEPGSELAQDDALLTSMQASHYVGHCLAVASDALHAASLLLRDDDAGLRINLAGQYPVLRTAVECAGLAVWILRPDSRRERLRRVLAARWDELGHDDKLARAFGDEEDGDERSERALKQRLLRENARSLRQRKKRLRDVAAANDIDEEGIRDGLPGYGRILREAMKESGIKGSYAQAAWHILSGLSHPSVTRSVGFSEHEVIQTVDEVHHVRLTARMDVVALGLDAALHGYREALELTARRGNVPELRWSPTPDLPLPPGYEWIRHTQTDAKPGAAFGI